MEPRMVRPDSKGRISLGHLADGISSFSITETKDHKIILEPFTEIPAREKWLFNNKLALKQVKQGLADVKAGRVSKRGSFADFTDEDSDTE